MHERLVEIALNLLKVLLYVDELAILESRIGLKVAGITDKISNPIVTPFSLGTSGLAPQRLRVQLVS
jgi:hypothetical protein